MALSVVLCIFVVAPILEISKFSFLLLIDISVLLKDSSGGSWGRGRGPSSIVAGSFRVSLFSFSFSAKICQIIG